MPPSRAKFEIVKHKGQFRWRLVVRGAPVAASLKGYPSKPHVKRAIEALKNNAAAAPVPDE